MRRIRYMLMACVALLSALACVRELPVVDPEFVEEAFPEGEPVTLSFSLPAEARTKALDENGTLNTLHIAVFGSSGYLKEYVKAEDRGAGTDTTYTDPYGNTRDNVPVRNFAVTLTLSEKPRILHFIGNGPTTLPFDADTTIMATLMSESGGQGFWQVKRVNSIGAKKENGHYVRDAYGNYIADQAIQDSLKLVPLIRNWSKISILTEDGSGFSPKSFAVVNVPDKGTIAPMYRILGSQGQDSLVFVEHYETLSFTTLERRGYPASLPNDARFVHTVPTKQDFISCTGGVVSYNSGAGATYLYERPIPSNELEPTFVIAYGTFEGDGKDYFYRIDLADKDGYYPVYRNFWYCINIQKIESVGHLTPEAAAQSSGGVNVSADVVTSHLGDISDGVARLVVQPWMTQTFPSQQIDNTILHAKFFADLASANPVMDLNAVTVAALDMEDDPSHPVITACSIGPASEGAGTEKGWRTITFSTTEPDPVKARTQILRVTAHYDQAGVPKTLYRDVEITLLPMQEMEVYCALDTIPRGIGKTQTLHISLPDGLLESMFPLNFIIEAENLSLMPAVGTNLPVIAGMSISDDGERKGEKSFYFSWTLSWDDYQAVVPVQSISDDEKFFRHFSCDFVTTRALSATTIWVANEFFHKAKASFGNSGLSNLPYFYVEATDPNGCVVTINQNGMQYQVDNDGWINYTAKDLIPLEEGQKLYIRAGSATSPVKDWSGSNRFSCTGTFNLGGNLASLVIGEDYAQEGANLTALAPGWKFSFLFQNKKTLQKASALEIPMTAMTETGFQSMFEGCTALTEPPALPSTTLASSCYKGMFKGCTLLKTAPALPARTLAPSCYEVMFQNCKALTAAPTLPAETLVTACYSNMFNSCSNITEIAMMATDISAGNCLNNWVYGVKASGTFYRNPKMLGHKRGNSSVPNNWTLLPWDEFRIEVQSPGTVSYSATDMEYSLNWGEWTDYTVGVNMEVGDNVRFRSTAPVLAKCEGTFSSTVDFIAAGNSMSLVAGEDYRTATSVPDEAFLGLFAGNARLKSVTSLELPAQNLGTSCYEQMFMNCTGLTAAPALPATTLSEKCYKEMFAGCTNLGVVICDAVDISASNCTQNWLQGVKGTGLLGGYHYETAWVAESNSGIPHGWSASNYFFVKALANNATVKLARNCSISYNGLDWTAYTSNTAVSLELGKRIYFKAGSASAPYKDWNSAQGSCLAVTVANVELGGNLASLMAGDDFLAEGAGLRGYMFGNFCYNNGFVRSALHLEFPMLTCEEGCYKSFFDNCKNLVSGPEVLPATTLAPTCYRNMFFKCSSLLKGPVLPATTIVNTCYQRMFYGCSSLTWVKMMGTNYIEDAFRSNNDGWMQGVPASGTFVMNSNASENLLPRSKYGIPTGWTIQRVAP